MATRKKTAKTPAKKVETRGRKKAPLGKQVWFRVSEEEKRRIQQEAEDQGRLLAGHIRWVFLKGWNLIHEQEQQQKQ